MNSALAILDSNILNCDEQLYVKSASTVRIGNFGAAPVIQQLPCPDPAMPTGAQCRRRMFIPVRGDSSIAPA